jgi:hypothetical protein
VVPYRETDQWPGDGLLYVRDCESCFTEEADHWRSMDGGEQRQWSGQKRGRGMVRICAPDDFNPDLGWILLADGMALSLLTGELRPARPQDLFTRRAGVGVGGGECPRFLAWLASWVADVPALHRWFFFGWRQRRNTARLLIAGDAALDLLRLWEVLRIVGGDYVTHMSACEWGRWPKGRTVQTSMALQGVRFLFLAGAERAMPFPLESLQRLTLVPKEEFWGVNETRFLQRMPTHLVVCGPQPAVRFAGDLWRATKVMRSPEGADQAPGPEAWLDAEGPAILAWMLAGPADV